MFVQTYIYWITGSATVLGDVANTSPMMLCAVVKAFSSRAELDLDANEENFTGWFYIQFQFMIESYMNYFDVKLSFKT